MGRRLDVAVGGHAEQELERDGKPSKLTTKAIFLRANGFVASTRDSCRYDGTVEDDMVDCVSFTYAHED